MSYISTVYNIMIASPSDVSEEREIARNIILDWNNIHSKDKGITLLPIDWEYNSTPTMGERPQQVINNQVLKNADLLIGIFWTRIGTPTGEAISGSVEEIEKHIKQGKPTMLYFSNKEIKPDKFDHDQFNAVKQFKNKCRNEGLTETFNTVEDFREKFQRQLAMKINEDSSFVGYSESLLYTIINDYKKPDPIDVISSDAIILLKEAIKDDAQKIFRVKTKNGFSIETNKKEMIPDNTPRIKAHWESVFMELLDNNLIKDIGNSGEIFSITNEGYKLIDKLLN